MYRIQLSVRWKVIIWRRIHIVGRSHEDMVQNSGCNDYHWYDDIRQDPIKRHFKPRFAVAQFPCTPNASNATCTISSEKPLAAVGEIPSRHHYHRRLKLSLRDDTKSCPIPQVVSIYDDRRLSRLSILDMLSAVSNVACALAPLASGLLLRADLAAASICFWV